jgi:hypothetical protein
MQHASDVERERPSQSCVSVPSGLETRGLHTLTREKAIDGIAMYTQHTTNAHCIEAAVVNQTADRLGMHA